MPKKSAKENLQSEKNNLGFSTDSALQRLSEEIEQCIQSYESKYCGER